MVKWDAAQYLRFQRERTQPAIDLANTLPPDDGTVKQVLDIGCGPGNSTAVLRERYPHARIIGVDSSPDMIDRAQADHGDCDFLLCDVSDETAIEALPHQCDVVFSNACIQWVPNHQALIPRMMRCLRDSGVLAVQTPMNYQEPIHRIIGEVARSPQFVAALGGDARIFYNLTPPEYWELLHGQTGEFRIWSTTYMHTLPSHQAIMDWYRGTGMRPYLQALDENRRREFESMVYEQLLKAYPIQSDGSIIFPFPRFFFRAVK